MTDYKEEQANEIEVLGSIYPEEFELLEEGDKPSFSIRVGGECGSEYDSSRVEVSCVVKFTYTEKYPDEKPEIEVIDYETLEESDVEDLLQFLDNAAAENLGMVMIFTLVSCLQEKLSDIAGHLKDRKAKQEEDAERRKEEEERKRFEGTRVTVETFMEWKNRFDAEMAALNPQTDQGNVTGKLTGRQLFERDSKLEVSDLQFLEEGDEDVQIDESLFQDIGDLELANLDDDDDDKT